MSPITGAIRIESNSRVIADFLNFLGKFRFGVEQKFSLKKKGGERGKGRYLKNLSVRALAKLLLELVTLLSWVCSAFVVGHHCVGLLLCSWSWGSGICVWGGTLQGGHKAKDKIRG